jgi:uncharacterized protein (TIGR02466 family)
VNDLTVALAAHKAGNIEYAENLYLAYLLKKPNDINANQLLGVLYSSIRRYDDAIPLLERSLRHSPDQPFVLNNLALCYKNKQNFERAERLFQKAIQLKPDFKEAHKNYIATLSSQEVYDKALTFVDDALSNWPLEITFRLQQANIYRAMGRSSKAMQCFEKLFLDNPHNTDIKHAYAVALRVNNKPREALTLLLTLERSGLNAFELFHNMGNAYSDLGELQTAVQYYVRALALNCEYIESHQNLNEILWELKEQERFLSSYLSAFEKSESSSLRFAYARTLIRIGDCNLALSFLTSLNERFKLETTYFELLGMCYNGLGNKEQALIFYEKMALFDSVSVDQKLNFIRVLIESNKLSKAKLILEEILQADAKNKLAIAYLGTCLRLQADPLESELNDYCGMVKEYYIPVPDNVDTREGFCTKICEYVRHLHTGQNQPLEQTLQGGTQTRGNLFSQDHPIVSDLLASIKSCLHDYALDTQPLISKSKYFEGLSAYQFEGSWSVKLNKDGYHSNHIHPLGTFSSVLYIKLPQKLEGSNSKAGWLKLGAPNLNLQNELPPKHYVEPKVGKLVIFPSYMWHGTEKFSEDDERITIAFDVKNADFNQG